MLEMRNIFYENLDSKGDLETKKIKDVIVKETEKENKDFEKDVKLKEKEKKKEVRQSREKKERVESDKEMQVKDSKEKVIKERQIAKNKSGWKTFIELESPNQIKDLCSFGG